MPTFVHAPLLWGLAQLLAVPVLIHLINVFRHRRMAWAAMEFLLESQKRHRRWIRMRQLLLLLLRMAAIAALVLLVARPRLPSRLGAALGTGKVHHVVLLDDSYSMTERRGDTTPFERGRAAIERIGREAAEQPVTATFTLLRFSQAGSQSTAGHPDMLEELVDGAFTRRLEEAVGGLAASELDSGPDEALAAIDRLFGEPDGEQRIIYIVSDFRNNEWREPEALRESLENFTKQSAQVHLVACVDRPQGNLTVTRLEPVAGIRAAGVPWFMEVTVENHSTEAARDVAVMLEQDGQTRPALAIDSILPGKSETRRFPVQFATAGTHEIAARLAGDPVAADNARYAVVDVPAGIPVLIVDGDPKQLDARFISTSLAPGGTGHTGLIVRTEPPSFLGTQPLEEFAAIILANFDRLAPQAVSALEQYVEAGGGLGIFLGPKSQAAFINESLYRDGAGLFPAPLTAAADLEAARQDHGTDLRVTDHPIFRIFAGERNSFLAAVLVDRYFGVDKDWRPAEDSSCRVIAQLRGGAPLAIEQKFGEGRVVAFLTTASPMWNNWAHNPSFVVAMLELEAYLASARGREPPRQVGSPLSLALDPGEYQPGVRFVVPDRDRPRAVRGDAVHRNGALEITFPTTDQSGFYELTLVTVEGGTDTRRYAFNVAPDEGDLSVATAGHLSDVLTGVPYEYHRADANEFSGHQLAGFELSQSILLLLVGLLLLEQFVAYLASYHLPAKGGG